MIKDDDYNKARNLLVQAGSKSAAKSHVKHTGKAGSPDGHGKSLIAEAKAEGIPQATLDKAEKIMGI